MEFADTTRRSIPETEREKIQNEWNTVRHNPGPEIGDMITQMRIWRELNGYDMIQADTSVPKCPVDRQMVVKSIGVTYGGSASMS